jgi:very-short-patch-repair endonuclease
LVARGLKPLPQYPVGTRYLDMAIDPDTAKLDVEVDGRRWHLDADGNRKVADRLRDTELRARGWKVLRFWVHELERDMGACVERIVRELD